MKTTHKRSLELSHKGRKEDNRRLRQTDQKAAISEGEANMLNKFERNVWSTTDLTLNIMQRCASQLELDINDDAVSDRLYWICCGLESWPEGEGFGSSDSYSYTQSAKKEFGRAS